MSVRTWKGQLAGVAQVTEYVFGGTWESSDVVIVTIGGKSVSITAGSTTLTTVIDNVVTAWNALDEAIYPEFAEITASRSGNNLRLTADTEGIPFACTVSTTETGGGGADSQTVDGSTTSAGNDTTACAGPNFWSLAGNWAEGAVPVDGDDVTIDSTYGNIDILYGLSQSSVELTSLTIMASYRGKIGLPATNAAGYVEYRTQELTIGAATLTIGQGYGPGSSRIKLNCEAELTDLVVFASAKSAELDKAAVQWRGTNASNTARIYGGDVGIALGAGHTAAVATLYQAGGVVHCGSGVTLTTIEKVGGTLFTLSAATTVNSYGGETTLGSGAHTTVNCRGGTVFYESTGTITNLNTYGPGITDFDRVNKARTVTNCVVTTGYTLNDKSKTVTFTNGIDFSNCSPSDGRLNIGQHQTLTPSAI